MAAVLTFVDGLFEGRYHTRKNAYDHQLAIKDLTVATDALTAANATQVFRAAEFFQVRDLLPVCGQFIRMDVVDKSNFIQILKEGSAGSFDALETYISQRFLVSTANKRKDKYGEFDLCLDYHGVYSIECHRQGCCKILVHLLFLILIWPGIDKISIIFWVKYQDLSFILDQFHRRVVGHYSTVLRNVIDRSAAAEVLTVDLSGLLSRNLEEALFVAVEFMYFKEMLDVPPEMMFKVLRVARDLNVVKLMESACSLVNPVTSQEWLGLYNASRGLRNPLIHRRVMLAFIKKFDAFCAVVDKVGFEDMLTVVKSDLSAVSEEKLYSAVLRWGQQPGSAENDQEEVGGHWAQIKNEGQRLKRSRS